MAATRTGNRFRTRLSKIATDLCLAALDDKGECGREGGAAMIALSIFWSLVLALFASKDEEPGASGSKQ